MDADTDFRGNGEAYSNSNNYAPYYYGAPQAPVAQAPAAPVAPKAPAKK